MQTRLMKSLMAALLMLSILLGVGQGPPSALRAADDAPQIEPGAGTWQTWVLASGDELRPAPPPDKAATKKEMAELQALVAERDKAAMAQIAYWDAGSPSYRWTKLLLAQNAKKPMNIPRIMRALSLLHVAIYDATIAAWDAKYAYNRPRPTAVDRKFVAVLPMPASPSYPDERAVAAGAAAGILAYLYPDDAAAFDALAAEASRSRLLAGVSFPSDVEAGLDLGRAVAARVIERAKADGSDAQWTGTVPTGPGLWVGDKPVEPLMGTWQPWVLESGDQFRSVPPPAHDSAQKLAEIEEIKSYTRTLGTNLAAFYWQSNLGTYSFYDWADRHIFEQKLDDNPPRAERIYALMSVSRHDSGIACYDSKYAYWAARPSMVDPTVPILFPPPPHPSYPAAHACNSTAIATVLAYLFPEDGAAILAAADEAAMSRIWAGIHFRSDGVAGQEIGRNVAQLVIERAGQDGAQSTE